MRRSVVVAVVGLLASAVCLAVFGARAAPAQEPSPPKTHGHEPGEHQHAQIPAAYAKAHLPDGAWKDAKLIARGKEIFVAKCALCHGEKGNGKGPGAASLPLKPADLTDGKMVAEMPGNYWLWRVSEGGLVEPFRSKGSVMPAWKGELSPRPRSWWRWGRRAPSSSSPTRPGTGHFTAT